MQIMRDGRGQHFDPDVADAFLQNVSKFADIAQRYRDEHAEAQAAEHGAKA